MTLNEDFRAFFSSKDVDFEQAVQEPVHNTGTMFAMFNFIIDCSFIHDLRTDSELNIRFITVLADD